MSIRIKKHMFMVVTLVSGIGFALFAQDNWTALSSGTTNNLWAMDFIDSLTGYIGGNSGTLFKTVDGGESWSELNPLTSETLIDIEAIDGDTIFVLNNDDMVLFDDGSDSWDSRSPGTGGILKDLCFINGTTGWAVGSWGSVVKTTDAGENWETQEQPIEGLTVTFVSVFFIDETHGWAATSSGDIIGTTDGGETWTQQRTGHYEDMIQIFFVNADVGFALADSLFKTVDGGETWSGVSYMMGTFINRIHFIDDEIGWASAAHYEDTAWVYKTQDGGLTWNKMDTFEGADLKNVFFTDEAVGYGCGIDGVVYKSSNGSGVVEVVHGMNDMHKSAAVAAQLHYCNKILNVSNVPSNTNLKLVNLNGMVVYEHAHVSSGSSVSLSAIANGCYIVNITAPGISQYRNLIIR